MRIPFRPNKAKDATTDEVRRILNQERAKEEASMLIHSLMEKQDIRRTDLADLLGCKRSNVTKLLDSSNFTLEKLADVVLAMGGHALHFYATLNPEQMRETIIEDDSPIRPMYFHHTRLTGDFSLVMDASHYRTTISSSTTKEVVYAQEG